VSRPLPSAETLQRAPELSRFCFPRSFRPNSKLRLGPAPHSWPRCREIGNRGEREPAPSEQKLQRQLADSRIAGGPPLKNRRSFEPCQPPSTLNRPRIPV